MRGVISLSCNRPLLLRCEHCMSRLSYLTFCFIFCLNSCFPFFPCDFLKCVKVFTFLEEIKKLSFTLGIGCAPVVDVEEGLVAHEEGPHDLQGGDLQGEVEGGDEPHRAEGPPVPIALLAGMVPRLPKGPGCKAHLHSHWLGSYLRHA